MTWLVYFHPRFAEEVNSLSSSNRLYLLTKISEQQYSAHILGDKDHCSLRRDPGKLDRHTHFFRLDNAIVAFNSNVITGGLFYLYIAHAKEDDEIVEEVLLRIEEFRKTELNTLSFADYIHALEPDFKSKWLKLEKSISLRGLYLEQIKAACQDVAKEIAALFNLTPSRCERFEKRIDFYLETLRNRLRPHGVDVNLTLSCNESDSFEIRSLAEISRLE